MIPLTSCATELLLVFPGERGPSGPMQGLSDRLSAGPMSEPGGPVLGFGVGPGPKTEPPPPSQQVVYVFTTSLANR